MSDTSSNATTDSTNDRYLGILLEKMSDELKAIHEEVGEIRRKVDNQPTRDEFNALKDDVRVIKAAVVDQSKELADHEHRISRLEVTS